MTQEEHVNLIKGGVGKGDVRWADLGSGDGAFTLALREIIGPKAELYSVDTNSKRLDVQRTRFDRYFPDSNIHYLNLDFTDDLPLPKLDGIIMANSLHFIYDKVALLNHIGFYLRPGGKLIVVEYNVAIGNVWVPFPVTYNELGKLITASEYSSLRLLATVPSEFLHEIYSAEALQSVTFQRSVADSNAGE